MKLKIMAVCAALLGTAAQAQELPSSVTQAYSAYQQAVETGDAEAALDWARTAYEAGRTAQIDPQTLAVLAENHAVIAAGLHRHETAADMFTRAGELYDAAGAPDSDVMRVERLAVEALFRLGEEDEAARRADALADALEAAPVSPARDFELARTRGLQAHAAWNSGRTAIAGHRGREAFEAWRRSGEPYSADSAFLAYYAGIGRAFDREDRDAAYWFEVARQLFATHEVGDRAPSIARAWGHYARGKLSDSDRRFLLDRLAEDGWVAEPCYQQCDNPDGEEDGEQAEDENNRDARPLSRRPPSYPMNMARAGVQGVTLVQFDIDARGRPQDIEVLFSAPHEDFGREAVRAIERWRYEPMLEDGEAVLREDAVTEFVFALEDR